LLLSKRSTIYGLLSYYQGNSKEDCSGATREQGSMPNKLRKRTRLPMRVLPSITRTLTKSDPGWANKLKKNSESSNTGKPKENVNSHYKKTAYSRRRQ
jgi:hypothetical protein